MPSIWDTSKESVTNIQPGIVFENPEPGTYRVLGIKGYVWTDDNNNPIFKPSKLNGEMQTLVRLKGGDHPDILATMTPAQLVVLVGALGANPDVLRPIETTTGFLLRVEEALSKITNPRKVEVKLTEKSTPYVAYWGNDFAPPLGEYMFKIAKVYSIDGTEPIAFKEYVGDAQIIRIAFEIVGDMWGNDSPYNGFRVSEPFYNPFAGVEVDENGERPAFQTLPSAEGVPVNVVRFQRLLLHFAKQAPGGVSWEEYQWQADPTRSQFGINELANPMEVVWQRIQEENRRARGTLSRTRTGRLKVDLLSFQLTDDPENVPEVDVTADKGTQSPELQRLILYIEDSMTPDLSVFKPTPKGALDLNLELTPEGVVWAQKNLVSIWDELRLRKVGGKRQFGALTPDECQLLYEALKGAYEEENLAF